jgi:hypothetical protein
MPIAPQALTGSGSCLSGRRTLSVTDINPVDYDSNQRQLTGAAHAAASWVRARRAAWSESPLEIPPAPSTEPPPVAPRRDLPVVGAFGLPDGQPQSAPALAWAPPIPDDDDFTTGADLPEPIAPVRQQPSAAARAMAFVRSVRLPSARWMAIVAAAALVLTVGATAKAYWRKGAATAKAAVSALDSVVAASRDVGQRPPVQTLPRTTGRLAVTSEPAGAQVVLDGKPRGVTPLTIEDLAPGIHAFELQSSEGSIRRSVVLKAGETAEIAESIFGGWVKVFAPFELTISEGAKVVRLEEGNQILLPAGRHELHFVNRTLEYETVHRVEVKPGETSTISVPPPSSRIVVNSSAPAEVWIDGVRVGETPLVGVTAPVGTHELVVRASSGEERHSIVTVTAKPLTVDIDFSKP